MSEVAPSDEREVVAKALYDHEPKYQRRHEGTEQRRYWVDLYASEKAVYLGRADAALAALSDSSN